MDWVGDRYLETVKPLVQVLSGVSEDFAGCLVILVEGF
jgi:hypothetical protein